VISFSILFRGIDTNRPSSVGAASTETLLQLHSDDLREPPQIAPPCVWHPALPASSVFPLMFCFLCPYLFPAFVFLHTLFFLPPWPVLAPVVDLDAGNEAFDFQGEDIGEMPAKKTE